MENNWKSGRQWIFEIWPSTGCVATMLFEVDGFNHSGHPAKQDALVRPTSLYLSGNRQGRATRALSRNGDQSYADYTFSEFR